MTLFEFFRLNSIREKLKEDNDFKEWMETEWNALYNDIINDTRLYPYFYNTIEQEYANR